MKILMFPTYFGGISWWRFDLPERHLRKAAVEVTKIDVAQAKTFLEKGKSFEAILETILPGHDILHIGYTAITELAVAAFKVATKHGVKIVVDIDDDVSAVPVYNQGWKAFYTGGMHMRTALTMLEHADAVSFSTENLQKRLSSYTKDYCVLQNLIDPADWTNPKSPARFTDSTIYILISGGAGRWGDYAIVESTLKRIIQKYSNVKVIFFGATPDWCKEHMQSQDDSSKNQTIHIQGTDLAEGYEVPMYNKILQWVSPDIMISPVVANTFNECKSHIRYLEAAMCGAAFACTDWPTYATAPNDCAIKLSNTETQWYEGLSQLIEDKQLRQRLSTRAKEHVLANCTIDKYINERIAFYERVLAGGTSDAQSGELLVARDPSQP